MKISKQKATEIALSMLEKKVERKEAIKKEFEDAVFKLVYGRVEKRVKEAFEQFKNYFNQTQRVVLMGNGFNYEHVQLDSAIPILYSSVHYVMHVTAKESLELLPIYQKLRTEEVEIKKLREEITGVLLGLGTYAKIKEHFPEAEPFLPEISKKEVMVISKDLVNRINS